MPQSLQPASRTCLSFRLPICKRKVWTDDASGSPWLWSLQVRLWALPNLWSWNPSVWPWTGELWYGLWHLGDLWAPGAFPLYIGTHKVGAIILPSYLPGLLCGSNEREFFVNVNELYSLQGLLMYTHTHSHMHWCVFMCVYINVCA